MRARQFVLALLLAGPASIALTFYPGLVLGGTVMFSLYAKHEIDKARLKSADKP